MLLSARWHEPAFDLKGELLRIAGVDLTDVPGISAITAHTITMEVGPDVSRFRSASAFASWLGLCPEKQVSGGIVLSTRARKVKNRAAIALRLGPHCLYHAKSYLGDFYRKMKWRLEESAFSDIPRPQSYSLQIRTNHRLLACLVHRSTSSVRR